MFAIANHSSVAVAAAGSPLVRIAAVSLLVLGAALHAPNASADTQLALTCIGTETGSTINFQYRWGASAEWRAAQAKPGTWQVLSYTYRYEGENRSPRLEVRFDDDMSSDVNLVRQKLNSFAARAKNCEGEGSTYHFVERRSELFLVSDQSRGGGGGAL